MRDGQVAAAQNTTVVDYAPQAAQFFRKWIRVLRVNPGWVTVTVMLCGAARAQEPSGDPHVHNAYGIELQRQGRSAESLAQFRRALDLEPRYADAAYNLALALWAEKRAAEALAVLDQYRFPSAGHDALRGSVLNALGRPEEAVVALRRAVALAPANADYLYDLIIVLLKTKQPAAASALVAGANKRFPRSAKLHAAWGMIAYSNGRNAEAIRAYETAARLDPGAADLRASLGDVYAAADRLHEAAAAYSQANRLEPANAEYRVKAGRNLLKLQRTAEAEAAFLKALEIEPDHADAHFQIGKLAADRGDDNAAVSHYKLAIASQPSLKEAWYQLSLSYRRSGQEEKSRQALERFRTIP